MLLLKSLLALDSIIEVVVEVGRVGIFFIGIVGIFFIYLSILLISRLNSSI